MNANTTNNNDYAESEINLIEVLQVLLRYKRLVLGIPAILMVLAVVISSRMTPVWEATAIFQVGRIGQNSPVTSQLIEPIPQVTERMGTQQFKIAAFASLNIYDIKSRQANLYKESLKVKQLKTTDLIELKVRGFSPEEAKSTAEGTVRYLKGMHDAILNPTISSLNKRLTSANENINNTRSSLEKFRQAMQSKNIKTADLHFWTLFSANLGQQLNAELKDSQQRKLNLEELLSPSLTYSTSLVNDVYVGKDPVSQRKLFNAMAAGGIGLLLGAFIALILNHIGAGRSS